MRYLHTMVRVRDIDASLDFYCRKLGLVEIYRYDSSERKYTNVFLSAPDDEQSARASKAPLLELTYNWPSEDGTVEEYASGRTFGHLAFEVQNIYDTCKKLMDSGIVINRPPRDGRMAFIQSPDHISIELLQSGDALPAQAPWDTMENHGTW